jgi:hypothetical protein
VVSVAAASAVLASGCGGSAARLDASEPAHTFQMAVVAAHFPTRQAVASPTALALAVRNTGTETAPVVAVTLDSFYYTEHFPELAANKRPVWVVERGPGVVAKPPVETQEVSQPGGATTAYVNTWALGPLAPGATQTFIWRVVPVKPGTHTVHFAVAAGLAGKSKVQPAAGQRLAGSFTVYVAPAPAANHVDPNTGRVAPGPEPATP